MPPRLFSECALVIIEEIESVGETSNRAAPCPWPRACWGGPAACVDGVVVKRKIARAESLGVDGMD